MSIGLLAEGAGFAAGMFTGILENAIHLVGADFKSLSASMQSVIAGQKGLADGAITGTNQLHNLTAALTKLPFGLGLIAQAMTYLTKIAEQNIKTYQDLSQTGARFGGDLNEVRASAKSMGLSMDEFGTLMKDNVSLLPMIGDSATEGARNLVKFNSGLLKSGFGEKLLGMGYTLTDLNNALGTYASVTGGIRKEQLNDQRKMQESVYQFATELDLSAELSGKTRKEKEDELKKASLQAAVNDKLSTMTQDQQKLYAAGLAQASISGQNSIESFQSKFVGFGAAATKGAQLFEVLNPTAARMNTSMTDVANSNVKYDAGIQQIHKNGAVAAASSVEAAKRFGKAGEFLTFQGGEMGSAMSQLHQTSAQMNRMGINSAEDAERKMSAIAADREKAEKSGVAITVEAQAKAKYFGDYLTKIASALSPLFPIIDKIIEVLPTIATFLADAITNVIVPLFKNLFGDIKFDDIVKPFKDFFSGFFGTGGKLDFATVEKGLANFLKPMITFVGNIVKSIDWKEVGSVFKVAFDTVGNFVSTLGSVVSNIFGGPEGGKKVGKELSETFGAIMGTLNLLINGIGALIKPFAKSPIISTLAHTFTDLFKILKTIVDGIIVIVSSPIGQFVISALVGTINLFFEALNFILDGFVVYENILNKIIRFVTGDFTASGDGIYTGLQDIVASIMTFVREIPARTVDLMVGAITLVTNGLKALFNGIVHGVVTVAEGVIHFVTGGYKDFLNAILEAIKGIISSIVHGIVDLGKGIGDFFKGAKNKSDQQVHNEDAKRQDAAKQKAQQEAAAKAKHDPKKDDGFHWPWEHPKPAATKPVAPQKPKPAPQPAHPVTPPQRENADLQKKLVAAQVQKQREAEQAEAYKRDQEKKQQEAAHQNDPQYAMVPTETAADAKDPVEILRDEIQLLNKNVQTMIRSMQATAENTNKTATLIASNGNLFRR